jgi:hypothetical protein
MMVSTAQFQALSTRISSGQPALPYRANIIISSILPLPAAAWRGVAPSSYGQLDPHSPRQTMAFELSATSRCLHES